MKTEFTLAGTNAESQEVFRSFKRFFPTPRRQDAKTQSRNHLRLASLLLCVFALIPSVHSATNDLSAALQRGLFEEEGNRDLDAAISAYQSLAAQFDKSRQVAATAIFRLGECYRKLGRTNEAVAQYDRIVREFSDQPTLVTLSRQNIAGLGGTSQVRALSGASAAASGDLQNQTLANLEGQYALLNAQLTQARALTNYAVFHQLFRDAGRLADQLGMSLSMSSANKSMLQEAQSTTNAAFIQDRERMYREWEQGLGTLKQQILDYEEVRLNSLKAAIEQIRGGQLQTLSTAQSESPSVADDEEKEIHRIQEMIQNSPDLINSTANGLAPLIQAAGAGNLRVVTFLLDHAADINLKSGGEAPLHAAAKNGNKAMVELLLNRGADVNATDGTGGTALHICAKTGFRSVAEVLLAHHADINARNSEMNNAATPLHRAAAAGNIEMLKLLIAHGADVNARTRNGSTPLDSALGSPRQLESINALLAAKADPDIADEKGITTLSDAVSRGYFDVVKLLLNAKANPNAGTLNLPLFCAINSGDTNMADLLLRAGADPNRPARIDRQLKGYGNDQILTNNPLEFACWKRQAGMARLLLQFKANPNGKDQVGQPIIFQGLYNVDVLQAMLEEGADPNSIGNSPNGIARSGETPLLVAARIRFNRSPGGSYSLSSDGDPAAAKMLIDHGANVNVRRPPDGATPLHLATKTDNRELVELLLANKADVNAQNNAGETPLDWAKGGMPPPPADAARLEIIELLRQHGAIDDLPDFKSIRITRIGAGRPFVVFVRDTNSINRFTLLEVIRNGYPNFGKPFPDFSKLIIHRPVVGKPDAGKEITVNLLTVTNSFDCTKDMWLEFGDVVEIPEREHTLAEPPSGITDAQSKELSQCLDGKVTFVVRGEKAELKLNGSGYTCWLQMALTRVQNLLRSSSDLSHIKIKRTDPATKKTVEFIADSKAAQQDNVWLRDGDVIEVPDK